MKFRVPAAILVALSLTLSACGGGDDPNDAIKKAAEKALQESIKDAAKDNSSKDSSKDSVSESPKTTTKVDDTSSSGSSSSGSSGAIPDLSKMGDCLTIGMTYAGLAMASMGGLLGGQQPSSEDLAKLQKSIDELRTQLPKELQSDFKVVADAYSLAAKEGFMSKKAQDALDNKDFDRANTNIQKYLDEKCGGQ